MVQTLSSMIPLGTKAPDFNLQDALTNNFFKFYTDENYIASVVMFICNHCPFVIHVNDELVRLANDYMSKNVRFFAINSNDVKTYPADSPENMKLTAQKLHYPFPYLFDETQDVAKSFKAVCTPDFFIFDKSNSLIYRGQLDESRPGNEKPVNGNSIRFALDSIIAGKELSEEQKPSIGCNIKWK